MMAPFYLVPNPRNTHLVCPLQAFLPKKGRLWSTAKTRPGWPPTWTPRRRGISSVPFAWPRRASSPGIPRQDLLRTPSRPRVPDSTTPRAPIAGTRCFSMRRRLSLASSRTPAHTLRPRGLRALRQSLRFYGIANAYQRLIVVATLGQHRSDGQLLAAICRATKENSLHTCDLLMRTLLLS